MPQEPLLNIKTYLPSSVDYEKDEFIVVDTMGRAFFVREMNSAMSNFKEESREEVWRKIWNLDVPERVKCFTWLFSHDRLLTNYIKSNKVLGYALCKLCG